MAFDIPPGAPIFWRNDRSRALEGPVMAYLAGEGLDRAAFGEIAEYLTAFIHQVPHGPCASILSPAAHQQLQALRQMAGEFATKEDLDRFVAAAGALGLDPF